MLVNIDLQREIFPFTICGEAIDHPTLRTILRFWSHMQSAMRWNNSINTLMYASAKIALNLTLFLKATHKKTLKKWTIERRTKKTVRWTCEKNQDYITVDVPRISMGCQSDFHSTTVCYLYCNRNKIWLILLRSCALLLRIPHLIPIGKKQTQNPINKGRKNSENGNRKMCPTREIKFYFSNTPQIASFETNNQFTSQIHLLES